MIRRLDHSRLSWQKGTGHTVEGIANGRMDVLGGIADYSGSMLLQMPIKEQTTVSIASRTDNKITISSNATSENYIIEIDPNDLQLENEEDILELRNAITEVSGANWPLYSLGCIILLMRDYNLVPEGMDISISSEVPVGKGVSSSAALEVATLRALREYYNLDISDFNIALLAQQVENNIVGAPCGLMDQLASCFGQAGHLLPIKCQPATVYAPISIPRDMYFVGIDSGAYHSVSGNSYKSVRAASFMGYSIIAKALGVAYNDLRQARLTGDWSDLPYYGYLANCTAEEFEQTFVHEIPESMSGKDFILGYGEVIDPQTQVDERQFYNIKACTSHPIYENNRISLVYQLLQAYRSSENTSPLYESIGAAMYDAHKSYTACSLGHPQTDLIVNLVQQKGPSAGVYGAKITGGGSGGTVCILARGPRGLNSARDIWQEYQQLTNQKVTFFESPLGT